MKPSSWIALIVALALLLGGGFMLASSERPSPPPEQLIAQTLRDAQEAAQQGSVNGVMDTISDNFTAGSWNKARLRLVLSRTLSQARGTNYDVHVNAPIIQPGPPGHPDERRVLTRFAAFDAASGEDYYKTSEPVILVMRPETRRHYLFFSEPYWRVVGVANLPALPGSGVGGGDIGTL